MSKQETKKNFTAKVIDARRVTIPFELAEVLGIKEGDFVEVSIAKVVPA